MASLQTDKESRGMLQKHLVFVGREEGKLERTPYKSGFGMARFFLDLPTIRLEMARIGT